MSKSFNNTLIHLFDLIKKQTSGPSNLVKKSFRDYRLDQRDYCRRSIELMRPHIKYISQSDECILSDDYSKTLVVLPELDLRRVWANCEVERSPAFKQQVWSHLQKLYLLAHVAVKQPLDDYAKGILRTIKAAEKLPGLIAEIEKSEQTGAADGQSRARLSELFGGDNLVIQLADEIGEELEKSGTQLDLMSLFSGPGGMKGLEQVVSKVGQKIKQKLAAGEISQDDLMRDAQKMRSQVDTKLKELVPEGQLPMIQDLQRLAEQASDPGRSAEENEQVLQQMLGSLNPELAQQLREHMDRLRSGQPGPQSEDQ